MTTATQLDWPEACERTVRDWRDGIPRRAYEITEEAYWWGLECVPPAVMKSSAYLCGEPYTHNDEGQPLYSAAVQTGGKFYALGLMTVEQLKRFNAVDLRHALGSCCREARETADWEERAGGALHCPECGRQIAQFRQ